MSNGHRALLECHIDGDTSVHTNAYFLNDVFSAFTKDSIDMMWGDKTGGDADLGALKPNVIIFLKVPAGKVKSRLKKEPADSSRSEVE